MCCIGSLPSQVRQRSQLAVNAKQDTYMRLHAGSLISSLHFMGGFVDRMLK